MVNLFAFMIMKNLKALNDQRFDCVPKFVGRQNSKGFVLTGDKLFEEIGLTDKRGNYFYSRLLQTDNLFAENAKMIDPTTRSYVMSIPLRIVVVVKEVNLDLFQYKLINDLIGMDLISFDRKRKPIITLNRSSTDYESIYKRETGKDITNWSGAYSLILIDFTLKYQIEYDECIDLDVWSNIDYSQFEEAEGECDNLDQLLERLRNL